MFLLFFSIIAKKALWHSGHQPQLCHTDWLWWWQIQTAASVKLVCSDSEVSILICFMPLNLQTNVLAALVFISSCIFRNRTGGKRTSLSWKQRVFMLLLVGVLGFFTLIIIMAKLGRASAGSDPNLDPLLNPNIRVGKNWKHALVLSLCYTLQACVAWAPLGWPSWGHCLSKPNGKETLQPKLRTCWFYSVSPGCRDRLSLYKIPTVCCDTNKNVSQRWPRCIPASM